MSEDGGAVDSSVTNAKDWPTDDKATASKSSTPLDDSKPQPAAKPKTKIVVTKRKRGNSKSIVVNRKGGILRKHAVKQTVSKKQMGLPSFQHRRETTVARTNHPPQQNVNSNDDDDEGDKEFDSAGDEDAIASETLVAIHSLLQGQRGLSIPLADNLSIQAVLENQIYATFQETNATFIHQELIELIDTNQIRQLNCQDKSTTAYVLTKDFVHAAWDATNRDLPREAHGQDEVVAWYVANLQHWTGRNVSTSELQAQWEQYEERQRAETKYMNDSTATDEVSLSTRPFAVALKHLMDLQLLIRDNSQQSTVNSHQDAHYHMWLPQWALVLKAWNDAKRQLINLLARSKETSKMNLLRHNRHSHVSTQFLLNELVYKGVVTVVERPFGSFVQLVKDHKQAGT